MQLQQLAYFLAVAETRHFTRAAEVSHVAQPSLSRQNRNLEEELGAALFTRARGNITLTPAGEALVPLAPGTITLTPAAEAMFASAHRFVADRETARHAVQQLSATRRGPLRLAATPSLCAALIADALAAFPDRSPAVELQVEESGSRDIT